MESAFKKLTEIIKIPAPVLTFIVSEKQKKNPLSLHVFIHHIYILHTGGKKIFSLFFSYFKNPI